LFEVMVEMEKSAAEATAMFRAKLAEMEKAGNRRDVGIDKPGE
jgi:hypothetical protein